MPHSIGDLNVYPVGEDIEEITAEITNMAAATCKPILDEKDFERKVHTVFDFESAKGESDAKIV